MKPIFEISLTPFCNFKCDYCIAHTEHEMIYAQREDTKEERMGWFYPKTFDNDTFKKNDDGSWNVKFRPLVWKPHPDPEDECIARNRKNPHAPVDAKVLGNVIINFDNFLKFVRTHLQGWDIILSGGEPLLLDKFDWLVLEIAKTNDVKILSNISKIKSAKFIPLLKHPRVQWKVGYHPEHRNLEEFKTSINFMKEHNAKFHVNFVKHPRMKKNEYKNFFKWEQILKDLEINYDITMFKGTWEGKEYGVLYKSGPKIGSNTKYVSKHALAPDTKDNFMWKPGKTFVTCYSDGTIYECHNQVKIVGNLNENTFEPVDYTKYLPCVSGANCHCDSMNGYRHMNNIHNGE